MKLYCFRNIPEHQSEEKIPIHRHINRGVPLSIRLKWLKRYRRYFLFRKKRLEILLNGEFDKKLLDDFMKKFKIKEIVGLNHKEKILTDEPTRDLLEELFEIFEEDIFKSEFELIAQDMSSEEKACP